MMPVKWTEEVVKDLDGLMLMVMMRMMVMMMMVMMLMMMMVMMTIMITGQLNGKCTKVLLQDGDEV